jgi:hypothetical protein
MSSNYYDPTDENKPSGSNNSLCCTDCFSYTKEECICDRIIGYDTRTGIPIVDLTIDEKRYLYSNQKTRRDPT